MNNALQIVLQVVITILVFGFLIFIHEFGHYITARIFKISITEFSIGMGPRLVWFNSKKTGIRYSLAMLPIGGFVSMVGENEDSEDPNAFNKKPAWQRFIVTAAGASVNLIFGFVAMIVLTCILNIGNTTIGGFYTDEYLAEEYSDAELDLTHRSSEWLQVGDTVTHVDGKRVKIWDELVYEVMRKGNEPVDVTVIHSDGSEQTLEDVVFPVLASQGQFFGQVDFGPSALIEKNPLNVISVSFRKSFLTMRMVWESLIDLITGRYTLAAVSGPVGISEAIGEAASYGVPSVLNTVVIISINLGIMNLLPIPALDGGRLAVLVAEMITRKKIPPKVEAIINGVGLGVLLLLSAIILVKDIVGLFI